jgi:hypothetical protein
MGWAKFWAVFVTNSSGHPAEENIAIKNAMLFIILF